MSLLTFSMLASFSASIGLKLFCQSKFLFVNGFSSSTFLLSRRHDTLSSTSVSRRRLFGLPANVAVDDAVVGSVIKVVAEIGDDACNVVDFVVTLVTLLT
jgi:hypothetical protein